MEFLLCIYVHIDFIIYYNFIVFIEFVLCPLLHDISTLKLLFSQPIILCTSIPDLDLLSDDLILHWGVQCHLIEHAQIITSITVNETVDMTCIVFVFIVYKASTSCIQRSFHDQLLWCTSFLTLQHCMQML